MSEGLAGALEFFLHAAGCAVLLLVTLLFVREARK